MPDQTLPTPAERTRPPSLNATLLGVDAGRVHVRELSDPDGSEHLRDFVSLDLGDAHAKVSVLGSLDEITDILKAAILGLDRVTNERRAGQ